MMAGIKVPSSERRDMGVLPAMRLPVGHLPSGQGSIREPSTPNLSQARRSGRGGDDAGFTSASQRHFGFTSVFLELSFGRATPQGSYFSLGSGMRSSAAL